MFVSTPGSPASTMITCWDIHKSFDTLYIALALITHRAMCICIVYIQNVSPYDVCALHKLYVYYTMYTMPTSTYVCIVCMQLCFTAKINAPLWHVTSSFHQHY